ncbi:hypothetical protein FOA52_013577 [Chlamydomonas sp. UWO 241]|nr:hypothetical protein FOA52_013577 [Chlamydomonas sp. UWO 241]
MLAAQNGHLEAVSMLLAHPSADAAAMRMHASLGGATALTLAAQNGHADAMRLLIDDPTADAAVMLVHANADGDTALVLAARSGHVDAVRLLLDHPVAAPAAMMMLTNSDGSTALMAAAEHGHVDAMRVLLEHSSFADAPSMLMLARSDGETAFMLAAQFATGPSAAYLPTRARTCEALLLLLRCVPVVPEPSITMVPKPWPAAQKAHMAKVMMTLCAGPHSQALFDNARLNDGVRDEPAATACVRLLVVLGADVFSPGLASIRPLVVRIVRGGE